MILKNLHQINKHILQNFYDPLVHQQKNKYYNNGTQKVKKRLENNIYKLIKKRNIQLFNKNQHVINLNQLLNYKTIHLKKLF